MRCGDAIISLMPHRPKGSQWFKTRITLEDGRTGVFACGTTDREVADDVERLVKNLHHKREWAALRAVVEKRTKLALVYDNAKAGKLDSFLAALTSPDLSPLVEAWPAKSAKYKIQVRVLVLDGRVFPATQFTTARITSFLDALDCSGSTKNRYRVALSQFAGWLRRKGIIAHNVVSDTDSYAPNPPRDVWLDRVQAKALIGALPMPFQAIEALMAATGVEWQVIERLTRRDVDLRKRTLHARGGKTRWRNRVVRPTEPWAWRIFSDYAKVFTENAALFPVSKFTALTEHLEASQILKLPRTTLHDWRHTYAVLSLKAGYSLQVVAHQLGHRDTTLVQTLYGRHVVEKADYRRHSKKPPSSRASRRGKRSSLRIA